VAEFSKEGYGPKKGSLPMMMVVFFICGSGTFRFRSFVTFTSECNTTSIMKPVKRSKANKKVRTLKIMSTFFWVLTPCSSVLARRFGGIYHFYDQDRRESQARKPVEAVCASFRLHVLVSCLAYSSTPNTERHIPPEGRALSKLYRVITQQTVPFSHGRENQRAEYGKLILFGGSTFMEASLLESI
jgi:hypothetical protein